MNVRPITHSLGFPRIGPNRELKKATEAYWKGALSTDDLIAAGASLRRQNWLTQRDAGMDLIPSNDFSFYDHVLDTTCLVGNVPARFHWDGSPIGLDLRFSIARGVAPNSGDHNHADCTCQSPTFASDMTKWFDTNYHYIVPEFHAETQFKLSSTKPFDEFAEALALGITTKPVLVGPVTYLTLGKIHDSQNPRFNRFDLLDHLLPVYIETIRRLAAQGAEWIQLDEPVFALDLFAQQRDALRTTYETLASAVPGVRLLVATYFGGLRENLDLFLKLPVHALHVDAVRAPEELPAILARLPKDKKLSVGIVDGRNIWKNDFSRSLELLHKAHDALGSERLLIAPSCSLLHSPLSLQRETELDADLRSWLAFADEKLGEVEALRSFLSGNGDNNTLSANQDAHTARRTSPRIHNPSVKSRLATLSPREYSRASTFPQRRALQCARLKLPLFPTTTIGSFPQTTEVRSARAQWKKGALIDSAYETFLEEQIADCVRFQDDIGLDMPVHGEFERNDMVEYFGEQLAGYAFTAYGWVQSYGSRCVKPPIIFGDVSRPQPMTVRWSRFAQSLTKRPMKGMLTGPVTMLQWSFVRDDQPRSETAKQIALALRDEVRDLEAAGIAAIQIDEPALREGLPLRAADWSAYLRWAVDAFRLTASVVRDDTQIHTHMCYSEFNDIIAAIGELDADVITIETSRSNMELLDAFVGFKYPNEIGPGVWDIHSPRVPSADEMERLLALALNVLPEENVWINPDCGLKTRGWPEVKAALRNMVEAADRLRAKKASLAPR